MADNVVRTLADQSTAVSASLGSRLDEITSIIDDKNGSFLVALQQASEKAVTDISATNSALKGDVEAIVSSLNDANATFQDAMNNVTGSLSYFEGRFTDQVAALQSSVSLLDGSASGTLDQLTSQVDALRSLTETTLGEIGALTQRFEAQGRDVLKASQAFTQTQTHVDATLNSRKSAIDQLGVALAERVATLESNLQGFHGMLEQQLQSAQQQAQAIANVVANTSASTAQALEVQLEQTRSVSDAERQRIAQTLKETSDAALADVN
ncbi:MAG: hypothetical protein B7Z15_13750, partial [Rhizobiales bacterium 32-66-8]